MQVSFEGLCVRLGQRCITEDLYARFAWDGDASDRVIALMGPSGSGKTTLAREILNARYGARDRRTIQIEPRDAVIAYLPQHPVLFAYLSLADNARLLARVGRYRERFDLDLFEKLTRLLRLDALIEAGAHVEQLSGGESQRLMLLRTLSVRPDLLILDEPAAGLDPAMREDFLIDLLALLNRFSINALYITHYWDEVRLLARRLAYAELTQAAVIHRLDTVDIDAFADAPSTVDAFKTVYGPGCSVWPLVSNTLACFAPAVGGPHGFRAGSPGHRLEQGIAERLVAGESVRAALYRYARFVEWRDITLHDFEEWH